MFAVAIGDDPDNTLTLSQDAVRPICGPGDVLIEVKATSVNRADLLQRKGLYPPPPGASPILGLEAAGIIAEVGSAVDGWQVGDRVCTLLTGGGYAQFVAAPHELLLPLPSHMSFVEAAAIPEVFYTAFLNLFLEGELDTGERLLVHAAASGVGTAAIQLALAAGASHVYGTASAPKLEQLEAMGCTAFDRHEVDFGEVIDEVDVILDPVAAGYLSANLNLLSTGGRLVVIGLLGGTRDELDLARLLRRRLRIVGSVLRSRSVAEKAEITRMFLEQAWPLFGEGQLEPIIDRVFELEEANEAHALLRTNTTFGKIVLTVS